MSFAGGGGGVPTQTLKVVVAPAVAPQVFTRIKYVTPTVNPVTTELFGSLQVPATNVNAGQAPDHTEWYMSVVEPATFNRSIE